MRFDIGDGVDVGHDTKAILLSGSLNKSVIVIGSGVAGLSAAYHLAKHGVAVTVLEAADRLGGRMSSDVREGFRIDRGAQFLSTGYAVIGKLIDRLGLASQLTPTAQWSGTVREGRVRKVNAERPWTVATSGLLGGVTWSALAF